MVQRYKIEVKRDTNGIWWVAGYWEVPNLISRRNEWDLDGKPLGFDTRKAALEHCLNVTGVPE